MSEEYIRRKSVTVRLNRWKNQIVETYGENDEYVKCLDDVVNIVDGIPAADVVEVRHGENISEDYDAVDQFVCSKCGIELQGWYMVERDMDDGEETHHEYVMLYCSNCGAKMDGGVNDGEKQ